MKYKTPFKLRLISFAKTKRHLCNFPFISLFQVAFTAHFSLNCFPVQFSFFFDGFHSTLRKFSYNVPLVHLKDEKTTDPNSGIQMKGDSISVSLPKLVYADDLTDKCYEDHQSLEVISGNSPEVIQFVMRCPSLAGFFQESLSKPNSSRYSELKVNSAYLESCSDGGCLLEFEKSEEDLYVGVIGEVHFTGDCFVDSISYEYPIIMPSGGKGIIFVIPLWAYGVFLVTVAVLGLVLWKVIRKLRRTEKKLEYAVADIASSVGAIEITSSEN